MSSTAGRHATALTGLLARHHSVDTTTRFLSALLGLEPEEATATIGRSFARSDEAESLVRNGHELLAAAPRRERRRPSEIADGPNGAVDWSGTAALSGRTVTPAFVVSSVEYTRQGPVTDLLMAGLHDVRRAGRGGDSSELRSLGRAAGRVLGSPAGSTIDWTRPTRRTRAAVRRLRHPVAAAALRIDARRRQPLSAPSLLPEVDEATGRRLVALAAALDLAGIHDPLHVVDRSLAAGPVRWVHEHHEGSGRRRGGIWIRDVLIDLPEPGTTRDEAWDRLRNRAEGAPFRLVTSRQDLGALIAELRVRPRVNARPADKPQLGGEALP